MALTSFYPQPGSSIFSTVTMTKKCTVSSCKSNYDSQKKKGEEYLTIFSFPRDPTDLESWLRAIPTKLPRTWEELKYRGVCHLHWPEDVPLKQNGRHKYPAVPPSIFSSEIAASILSSPPPPPRPCSSSPHSLQLNWPRHYRCSSASSVCRCWFWPPPCQSRCCGCKTKGSFGY